MLVPTGNMMPFHKVCGGKTFTLLIIVCLLIFYDSTSHTEIFVLNIPENVFSPFSTFNPHGTQVGL